MCVFLTDAIPVPVNLLFDLQSQTLSAMAFTRSLPERAFLLPGPTGSGVL